MFISGYYDYGAPALLSVVARLFWLKWLQRPGGFKVRVCEPVKKAEFDVSGSNQSSHLILLRPSDVPPPHKASGI